MDQTRQRERPSRACGAAQIRSSQTFERGRPPETPGVIGARCREFWLSRQCMDLFSSRQSNPARVWGEIPSRPCQPHTQRLELDPAKADPASQTAQGRRNPAVEGRGLASVEKKAIEEGRTIVFIDESGVYLLPIVVRSYAPSGQTPILKEFLSYQHLSLIGAVTPQGRLFLTMYSHSITAFEIVHFLGQLQRQIPGLLLIIWDGIPTHRSRVVKSYLSAGASKRIHLEQLPGYAPDLNPVEWVWSYLKIADLANVACDHLSELETLLQYSKRRLQRKPEVIQAFIRDAGYEV